MKFSRITDNHIKAKTLRDFFDEIRMRDAEGYELGFIEWKGFKIEFKRSLLRRNCIEGDVRIWKKS